MTDVMTEDTILATVGSFRRNSLFILKQTGLCRLPLPSTSTLSHQTPSKNMGIVWYLRLWKKNTRPDRVM